MSEPDIILLGLCKLIWDFLDMLHHQFPKRKRVELLKSRFMDVFVRQNPRNLIDMFHAYFAECNAEKSGIMQDVFSKENLQIVNSKQRFNRVFSIIKLDTIFTEQTNRRKNLIIWDSLKRISQGCDLFIQNPSLWRLLNTALKPLTPKIGEIVDVDQILQTIEQVVVNSPDIMQQIEESARRLRNVETVQTSVVTNVCVTKEGVDFLPWIDVREKKDGKEEEKEEEEKDNICCICFDTEPSAKIGGCEHDSFCYKCLYEHVKSSNESKCPLCRHKISIIYVKNLVKIE